MLTNKLVDFEKMILCQMLFRDWQMKGFVSENNYNKETDSNRHCYSTAIKIDRKLFCTHHRRRTKAEIYRWKVL